MYFKKISDIGTKTMVEDSPSMKAKKATIEPTVEGSEDFMQHFLDFFDENVMQGLCSADIDMLIPRPPAAYRGGGSPNRSKIARQIE
jgi:hypothetical protein